MRRSTLRPFTLIELLVVVSIIAVLAAMLLPALGRARKKVKSAVCMGNTRTLMQASTMYALDYDNWLPRRGNDLGLNFSLMNVVGVRYMNSMKLYLPDTATFHCPDGAISGQHRIAFLALYGGTLEYGYWSDIRSTTVTTLTQTPGGGVMALVPNRLTDDKDGFGGMSMVYSDMNRWQNAFGGTPIHTNHPTRYNVVVTGSWGGNYNSGYPAGLNNAYIDGHSEWLPTKELSTTRYFLSYGGSWNFHWR